MTDPSRRDEGDEDRAILGGLFVSRPRSEDDLRARLAPVDPAAGRRWIFERLRQSGAKPRDAATVVGALRVLGLGAEDGPALGALLLDATAEVSGRAVALALLSALDPARAQELAQRLSPDDLMALNDAQLTSVIASIPTTPDRVIEITQKLARQPPGSRPLRLAQIERIRRRLGIPAALLYWDALADEALGLAGPLVDLVVEEGGEGAAIRFEQRFRAASGTEAEARWAQALARVYQVAGRPAVEVARAEAFRGAIAGDTVLVLCLESAVDGSFTLASARLGPAEEKASSIVDAAVVSLATQEDMDELIGQLGGAAKATLAEVSAPVEEAARAARAAATGIALSMDTAAAICFFSLAGRLQG